MSLYFRVKKFVEYQWIAKTQYYLHSPFVYRFYLDILQNKDLYKLYPLIEYRKQLHQSRKKASIRDLGTGKNKNISLSVIERDVAVRHKYGRLLFSLVQYFKPIYVLEIGTSIGISSSYISLASSATQVITLEGSPELVAIAKETHSTLGLNNIEVIEGEFSLTIPQALTKLPQLDLVYFDGNHTKEATLNYFKLCLSKAHEHSVFVFDDIYWNKNMNTAWEEVKQHPSVTLTVDVYQFGICFFRKENLAKESFVLRY